MRPDAATGGAVRIAPDPVLAHRWRRPGPPIDAAVCAACDAALAEPFGWCSGCRLAFCFGCGRGHFCRPGCAAGGCHAGLCVREVRDGVVSERWGLPPE